MKNIVKYFLVLSAVAVSFACQKEVETFQPGEPEEEGCYGVFFPVQDASGSHIFNPTQDPKIDITVARTNTKGAITVPIIASYSHDGVFETTPVSFADGQSETTFTLSFDKAKEGTNYSASFQIDDNAYASKYSSNAIALDFSVMRVEMKDFMTEDGSKKAMVTFTDNVFWGEVHDDVYIQYYEVDGIRYCTTTGGKLVSPLDGGTEGAGPWGTNVQLSFKWYTNFQLPFGEEQVEYDVIEVVPQYHGWDYSNPNAEVWYADYYNYYVAPNGAGKAYDAGFAKFYQNNGDSYPSCYYDGHGGFVFNLVYWLAGTTSWFGFKEEAPVGIAEGYLRVDYGLKLESDYTVNGVTPVYVETGVDVKSIKYALVAGELSNIQTENAVADILAGKLAATEFSDFKYDEDERVNYATLGIEADETGTYTLIVLAFDEKKNNQNAKSISFRHIAAGDTAEYAVDIEVKTEATPDRYVQTGEYNEYNSFAFYVLGNDVTDAHILVTPYKKLTNADIDDLKYSTKNAVSAEVLEKINGEGGYYTVVGGLDPGTEYIVLVWATNGSEDTYVFALWETTPSPEVWKPIGKGVYTDDFFASVFNGVENLTWEVDMEQSEDDPTRFKMIYPYDGKYLYNDDGDWDTSKSYDIIVTVTDPDHVWIAPQEIGVNWGYGMINIASNAGRYMGNYDIATIEGAGIAFGTCVDGVITFPEKECVMKLPDYSSNWLVANANGAFKLVLPEGVSASAPKPSAAPAKKSTQLRSNLVEAVPQLARPVFEREPKAVEAKVTVSYGRKACTREAKPATVVNF